MTTQHPSKPYWKDALRQAQEELEAAEGAEKTRIIPARNRKWAAAYRQARADLEVPGAIVRLPDEIADVICQAQPTPEPSPAWCRRLKTFLLALLFLLPALISYLLAHRRLRMNN